MGYGDTVIQEQVIDISAGGVYTEPSRLDHYTWAKNGEVVLQVVGSENSKRVAINKAL
ncbi:hypothetical protein [Teredinibacter haidensis]|uniref:hypothetical protein n=1 Tax=Teredinibacter haidensis TaxID=2731755 RepID=UPI000AB70DFB|nr:hypothetical protein [Teredinibacter haidensis]